MSTAARGHNGSADFNPLAPEGSYTLTLSDPTDRAVAVRVGSRQTDDRQTGGSYTLSLSDPTDRAVAVQVGQQGSGSSGGKEAVVCQANTEGSDIAGIKQQWRCS